MISHKILLSLFTAIALLPATAPALAAPEPAAATAAQEEKDKARLHLVQQMTDMTLAILQDQKKSFTERESTMERGITNMVDIPWIARFVLGNAWKTATPDQRERYTELYRTYLTKMYISNFAQNKDRKVSDMHILGIARSEEDTFVARTEVLLSTGEALKVEYMVSERPDTNKIIDVSIEGVSLLASHRAQFASTAQQKGVEGVITELKTLASADKPNMNLSMK